MALLKAALDPRPGSLDRQSQEPAPPRGSGMGILGARKADAGKSKDPVCGMVVVEEHAFGPEESAAGAVWFCSVGCQAQYQAERSGEAKRKGQEEGVEA